MKKITFISLGLLMIISSFGQVSEFSPNGKPILRIYSNYHTTVSNGESASAFELQRVYLGYEHNFSEHLSGAAVFDVGDPGFGKLQMTAFVKNAYLRYKANNMTVNFGMIATTQFKLQEGAWGYRYLEKSFQDAFNFNSSADLGASVAYKITDYLSADVIVANGEGYKKIEADSTLRTGFGLTLKPVKNLTLRAYYDFSTKINTQSSVSTFIAYAAKNFNVGAEYMLQLNQDFVAGAQWSGTSFFGTLNLSEKFKLFGRYDNLMSNTLPGETVNWNLSGDGQLFIGGIEFSPVRGVKLAPNFKGWKPADSGDPFISTFILNCEVKF